MFMIWMKIWNIDVFVFLFCFLKGGNEFASNNLNC